MLVISNGAFKSGSTWMFNILKSITHYSSPPQQYINPNWNNPSIHPNSLEDLLKNLDYENSDYLVKNHFGSSYFRNLLLEFPNVEIFNIKRDNRDVIVSAYYHYRRTKGYKGDFRSFYWKKGRYIGMDVRAYNSLWDDSYSQVHVFSYEKLKSYSALEIQRMGSCIGIPLCDEEVKRVQDETNLPGLIRSYGRKPDYYRKGDIGDWQNHYDRWMYRDWLEAEGNKLPIISIISRVLKKYVFTS